VLRLACAEIESVEAVGIGKNVDLHDHSAADSEAEDSKRSTICTP
jgi:hypothetical protein